MVGVYVMTGTYKKNNNKSNYQLSSVFTVRVNSGIVILNVVFIDRQQLYSFIQLIALFYKKKGLKLQVA